MQIIHARQALTPDGWKDDIAVTVGDDGRIAQIGPQFGAADSTVGLLLPAPVNLHSHAFQRAMAGLSEARSPNPADSFWTWRELMYRFLTHLTPDDVEVIAAQVFMEMLENGYAAVAEFHYLHHAPGGTAYANPAEMSARIIAAAKRVGLGLTLLPVLYQYGGCDQRPLSGGQLRFGNTPDSYANLLNAIQGDTPDFTPDFTLGVAPHSLRATSPEALRDIANLRPDAPIHIHIAEQQAEVDEVLAHRGARPVEWLLDHAALSPRWCAIHATQMTAAETTALAQSGTIAGLCPITESNLGDGIFNGTEFLGAGGSFGVGSDSNIHITLFEELRVLEYSQRLRHKSRAALARPDASTGHVLYTGALKGGARAAGRNSGALAPGLWADMVALATDNAFMCNRKGDKALDTAIFGGHGPASITDVWSAGRHKVQSGQHRDHAAITRDFCATMAALHARL